MERTPTLNLPGPNLSRRQEPDVSNRRITVSPISRIAAPFFASMSFAKRPSHRLPKPARAMPPPVLAVT
jgi:hypothetical protein